MKMRGLGLTLVILLLSGAMSVAADSAVRALLRPDEAPVRYVDRAPEEGTPQHAMVSLVLLREQGRASEAAKWISSECPDWLRETMLRPVSGSVNRESLSYQLREFTPTRALVSVDYNTHEGKNHGWTRTVILEDGRWVVR